MSVNSSRLPPALSSSSNMFSEMLNCFNTTVGTFSITAITVTSVLLLLPLYIFVLYLGLQRWWQQRSGTTMSHSDFFAYHMVCIELISVFGSCLCCCGVHTDHPQITLVGVFLGSMNLIGQELFHILTCVERYLAVVHPVTYRSLKEARGIRMRNVIIGCVWLLCFAHSSLLSVKNKIFVQVISYVSSAFSLTVVAFCSLYVLCVLRRPGPGEGGADRQRVDKSKLRAFYTITAILVVLLFRFVGFILLSALYDLAQLGDAGGCVISLSIAWFSLPSCLVLSLLFLQKEGKLPCCKSNK